MRPVVVALVLVACASGPAPEPTMDAPQVGCIMPTPMQAVSAGTLYLNGAAYEGKRLPEIVRILGTYADKDGFPLLDEYGEQQWMILRSGEYDTSKWQPWAKSKIKTGPVCGREASAVQQVITGDPTRERL